MRKILRLIPLLLLISPLSIHAAAEEGDSLAIDLGEIVVEGRTQRVIQQGVEYIPGKKMKKAANDARSLLLNMQIPQLNVSPIDGSIKTIANAGVNLFIDYVRASEDQVNGLRPEDVLRVEVLDYPEDPRFGGSDHVVNFIMQHYEWGGYTKLQAGGTFLSLNAVNGSAYEKFAWRNWLLDASVYGNGSWDNKSFSHKTETLRDFGYDGKHIDELTRVTDIDYSHVRRDNQQATLRAAYSGNTSYISHTFSFNRAATPRSDKSGHISYSSAISPDTGLTDRATDSNSNYSLSGYYQIGLRRGQFLIIDWSFSHSDTKTAGEYRLGQTTPLLNGATEKTETPQATIYYTYPLKHNNSLRAMVANYTNLYDTRYTGSFINNQKLISSQTMLFLEYMQYFPCGISLYSRVGGAYVLARLNGATIMSDVNPRLGLSLQYQINSRNSVGLEGWWANSQPQASIANDALVRQDELLWVKGNPDLRNVYGPMFSASYSHIPSNWLGLSASATYDRYEHMPVYVYSPMPGYDGIIRTFGDDETERHIKGTVAATGKFLHNSLVIGLQGSLTRTILSGIRPMNLTDWTGQVTAAYYAGPCSFMVAYITPEKALSNKQGWLEEGRHATVLSATYSAGDLNVNVALRNWFGNGRYYSYFNSPHYSSAGWERFSGRDRTLNVTLTYTLPYGKKVDRSDEVRNNASRQSAIIE